MTNEAIAYIRTSSATNVGTDKDSVTRQRLAIEGYAAATGLTLVDEFRDVISGADAVQDRPGFAAMLDRIEGNGVRLILVEDASRFARDLMVQEAGLAMLAARGVRVLTAAGDDMTATDDPMRIMMRQIIGAVVQAEKARLVGKLKAARDRKSAVLGYTVNSSYHKQQPGIFDALRAMKAEGLSQAAMAERLETQGFVTKQGKRLHQTQVGRLLADMEKQPE